MSLSDDRYSVRTNWMESERLGRDVYEVWDHRDNRPAEQHQYWCSAEEKSNHLNSEHRQEMRRDDDDD